MTSAPIAALGGDFPLNPPRPLYEVTLEDVERAQQQLTRFWTECAETVRAYEYERGMGISAAGFYGANAARHTCDDAHHDFIDQN